MEKVNASLFPGSWEGGKNIIINEILKIEIGEVVKFSVEEWKPKSHPSMSFSNYGIRHGKKFLCRKVGNDYFVKRVK